MIYIQNIISAKIETLERQQALTKFCMSNNELTYYIDNKMTYQNKYKFSLENEFENLQTVTINFSNQNEYNRYINNIKSSNGNVLVFADCHHPASHNKALEHCLRIRDKYNCKTIVNLGDWFDNYVMSRFIKHPEHKSYKTERDFALEEARKWYKEFPNCYLTLGNHDLRVYKMLSANDICSDIILPLRQQMELPETWIICYKVEIDKVVYCHGDGRAGMYHSFNYSKDTRQSTVLGHTHTNGMVKYYQTESEIFFAMNPGALADDNTIMMDYGRRMVHRSVIGCGVVTDYGKKAIFEPII